MRSCIYCGKELEKGEVCDCPRSVAYRQQKANSSANGASADNTDKTQSNKGKDKKEKKKNTKTGYGNPYRTETSYKTGYAGDDGFFERAKTKRRTKKAAKSGGYGTDGGFKGFWRYIWEMMKSPIEKIQNPGHLSKIAILTIAAIQGAVLWLCLFFVLNGHVGPFRLLASLMSFNGISGYKLILTMLLAIVSGAVSGVIMFFLYSGIFYLINRFLLRLNTRFWEFSIRLVSSWIPFTVICVIGALLSIISPITLLVLLICGAMTVVVLTYEALRTEWISRSPGKVMYAMILGYFVFFAIVCHLIFI